MFQSGSIKQILFWTYLDLKSGVSNGVRWPKCVYRWEGLIKINDDKRILRSSNPFGCIYDACRQKFCPVGRSRCLKPPPMQHHATPNKNYRCHAPAPSALRASPSVGWAGESTGDAIYRVSSRPQVIGVSPQRSGAVTSRVVDTSRDKVYRCTWPT